LNGNNSNNRVILDPAPLKRDSIKISGKAIAGPMYCPKCNKTIKDERLEEVNKQLVDQFNKDSLSKGMCPVCGTRLLKTDKKV
jgi:ssDNA-binding Zn-finger/Zn-ribbon topoisomerase 1